MSTVSNQPNPITYLMNARLQLLPGFLGPKEVVKLKSVNKEVHKGAEIGIETLKKGYSASAEKGSIEAQFQLGFMHDKGIGWEKDPFGFSEKAFKYYTQPADQGHAEAQYHIGCLFLAIPNHQQAVHYFEKAAKQGHAKAQCALGAHYEGGGIAQWTRPQNYPLSFQYYKQAAEQGDAYGQHCLAIMYKQGQGCTKDYGLAFSNFQKAANQGLAIAQNSLGLMYEKGLGCAKDEASALKWYEEAAKQGNRCAQFSVGYMYERGKGCTRDTLLAIKWYKDSATQKYSLAQLYLGSLCNIYVAGWTQYENLKHYKYLADDGEDYAQFQLGAIYESRQDLGEAVKYFKQAADQGCVKSLFRQGLINQDKTKDYTSGFTSYKEIADYCSAPDAQYAVGHGYELGVGVAQDKIKAKEYYEMAAKQGHQQAQQRLTSLK